MNNYQVTAIRLNGYVTTFSAPTIADIESEIQRMLKDEFYSPVKTPIIKVFYGNDITLYEYNFTLNCHYEVV